MRNFRKTALPFKIYYYCNKNSHIYIQTFTKKLMVIIEVYKLMVHKNNRLTVHKKKKTQIYNKTESLSNVVIITEENQEKEALVSLSSKRAASSSSESVLLLLLLSLCP